MLAQDHSKMCSIGAREQRKTARRRPWLVGALAIGVVTLGASAAVAVGTVGSPPPAPSATGGHGTSMMRGTSTMSGTSMMPVTGTGIMSGTSAMPSHSGVNMPGHQDMSMMSGTSAVPRHKCTNVPVHKGANTKVPVHKGTSANTTGGTYRV